MENYLSHHGIQGQEWGKQNGPPYPLDPLTDYSMSEKKKNKIDKKWIRKNEKKIRRYAESETKDELKGYAKELSSYIKKYNTTGKISKNYATAYSKKMAELMNKSIDGLQSPSGRVVKFIAKRGEIGVYTALADKDYDLSQVKSGIYSSGKVAYKKQTINKWE